MEYVKKQYKRFKHPFTCKIAGPSGCGKTQLMRRILETYDQTIYFKNEIPSELRVIWAYGEEGAVSFEQLNNINMNYIEGLPSSDEIEQFSPHILIIDDLMNELADNSQLSSLFTKGRHKQISTFFIVQNALPQGRAMRNVNLNTHYVILFNNPNDNSQTELLASRFYPRNRKFFTAAFEDATNQPYGYIRRDNTADTPNKYRLQTNITPIDEKLITTCYIPKNV